MRLGRDAKTHTPYRRARIAREARARIRKPTVLQSSDFITSTAYHLCNISPVSNDKTLIPLFDDTTIT